MPAGFDVQLVASEPDIQKPMQMAFDAKGRLWVTTSYHYPFAAPHGKGTDKLFVLSDFDAKTGKARKVETFAADLNIPIGVLPLPDCKSCIVSSVERDPQVHRHRRRRQGGRERSAVQRVRRRATRTA